MIEIDEEDSNLNNPQYYQYTAEEEEKEFP